MVHAPMGQMGMAHTPTTLILTEKITQMGRAHRERVLAVQTATARMATGVILMEVGGKGAAKVETQLPDILTGQR